MAQTVRFEKKEIEFPIARGDYNGEKHVTVNFHHPLRDAQAFTEGLDLKYVDASGNAQNVAVHRVYYRITQTLIAGPENNQVQVGAEINLRASDAGYLHAGKLWVVVIGVEKDRANN